MVYTVCLVRHGESVYNSLNIFTGWTDVDLSELGTLQALRAGNILRAHGVTFDLAFTSVLKRAVRTMSLVLGEMDLMHITDVKTWRLNERHYGALQGLNKAETAEKYGDEQVHQWRRGYAIRPPPLAEDDLRHPRCDPRYFVDQPPAEGGEKAPTSTDGDNKDDNSKQQPSDGRYLPATESLQDCVARTLPCWHNDIVPAIRAGRKVLVAAHGNSLRGIVKHLDDISDEDVMNLEIPVGTPLMYELDEETLKPVRHYYLGEHQVISSAVKGASTALAQPSSWGLLTPPGPLLTAWLNGLKRVGLIKPLGLMMLADMAPVSSSQATGAGGADVSSTITEATGTAAGGPTTATAAASGSRGVGGGGGAAGDQMVVMEDPAAVLQHSRFVVVDLSEVGSALPPALLLGRVSQQLDPAQHTLLLVTAASPVAEAASEAPPSEKPLVGTKGEELPENDGAAAEDLLPMIKEAASHFSHQIKVLNVQLAPAPPSPADITMAVARASSGANVNQATKPTSPANPSSITLSSRVTPLSGAVQPDDIKRLQLMLQYTGRPTTTSEKTSPTTTAAEEGAAAEGEGAAAATAKAIPAH